MTRSYIKNIFKKSTKYKLEGMDKLAKLQHVRSNMQVPVMFLYASNEQSQNKIKKKQLNLPYYQKNVLLIIS